MLKCGTALQQAASPTDTLRQIFIISLRPIWSATKPSLINPVSFCKTAATKINSTHILDTLFKPEGETQQINQPEANGLSNMLLSPEMLPGVRPNFTFVQIVFSAADQSGRGVIILVLIMTSVENAHGVNRLLASTKWMLLRSLFKCSMNTIKWNKIE